MLVIKVKDSFTDASLPTLERDPLLSGDNNLVKFLFDAAFPFSYAGGNPVNNQLVRDVSETANGKFNLSTGQVVTYSGNGFDFSSLTATTSGSDNCNVQAPAGVWSGIQADQVFLVCIYIKTPAESDWNTVPTIFPFFAGSETGYQLEADPITISQGLSGGIKAISFRRQTAINAQELLELNASNHYGKFTQVAYWRTSAGTGCRLKSPDAVTSKTGAVGSLNTANFSTAFARFGVAPPFTNFAMPEHQKARNFKLYRGFIENLALSGRNPVDVLDADFDRVVARNVFS